MVQEVEFTTCPYCYGNNAVSCCALCGGKKTVPKDLHDEYKILVEWPQHNRYLSVDTRINLRLKYETICIYKISPVKDIAAPKID